MCALCPNSYCKAHEADEMFPLRQEVVVCSDHTEVEFNTFIAELKKKDQQVDNSSTPSTPLSDDIDTSDSSSIENTEGGEKIERKKESNKKMTEKDEKTQKTDASQTSAMESAALPIAVETIKKRKPTKRKSKVSATGPLEPVHTLSKISDIIVNKTKERKVKNAEKESENVSSDVDVANEEKAVTKGAISKKNRSKTATQKQPEGKTKKKKSSNASKAPLKPKNKQLSKGKIRKESKNKNKNLAIDVAKNKNENNV